MKRREQICVPVNSELRRHFEEAAKRENRTLAGQIRHTLLEAIRSDDRADDRRAEVRA